MNRTTLIVGGAIGAVIVAIAAVGAPAGSDPDPGSAPDTTAAETNAPPEPQGDGREKGVAPITVPEAGRLGGAPLRTARRFMEEWLNRRADAAELRRQRPILLGLSTGELAQLVAVTVDDALDTENFGPENEGRVLVALDVPEQARGGPAVLVLARERIEGADRFSYTTYIVRLAPVDRGYAVSDMEPQQ